jgi:hypothetical protein
MPLLGTSLNQQTSFLEIKEGYTYDGITQTWPHWIVIGVLNLDSDERIGGIFIVWLSIVHNI